MAFVLFVVTPWRMFTTKDTKVQATGCEPLRPCGSAFQFLIFVQPAAAEAQRAGAWFTFVFFVVAPWRIFTTKDTKLLM